MPDKALASPPFGKLTNEQLVDAAQRGDAGAISELVARSHVRVRRFAHMLCSTPEDAEEATQEALIILYRKIGTLRVAAALGSWMFQVTRRECIRRSKIALRVHAPRTECEPSAEEVVIARLELERIASSIAQLEPEQRAVLVLRDVHGLSGAATAERLGVSRAAMKSRLHRAREHFRSQLAANW
ncbi:MAG TPA: RNA polymerase sigma factor [Solirubrobacteraceae bacterium]|jgi:RNA polymerase sigma factor (sigma-70 family)|nr:RNA polymerase sigma factor [Solirubrobacteraceae bacterium]